MKASKSSLYLLFAVFLIATFLVIGKSYALFESNIYSNMNMSIGNWVIKVNDALISDGAEETIVLDDFVYTENENVETGYIAPGMDAYCDIVLDPTGTDVAIRYDITLDVDDLDYSDNVSFTVSQVGGNAAINTAENTYSGVIDLEDMANGDLITLRIAVEWLDIEDYNEVDTELGLDEESRFVVPMSIDVLQYLGEEITPYVPEEEENLTEE